MTNNGSPLNSQTAATSHAASPLLGALLVLALALATLDFSGFVASQARHALPSAGPGGAHPPIVSHVAKPATTPAIQHHQVAMRLSPTGPEQMASSW
jgi:hypothetical protein